MESQPSTYTVAKFCKDLDTKDLVVNREYQRTPKVWPPAAQSYLIDTILNGFPIPKLTIWQKTSEGPNDSFISVLEIVDGQQRTQAIASFYRGELRLTTGTFKGKKFADLDSERRSYFAGYAIGYDLLIGATEAQVREIFRRINSYTMPLNSQEKRYAEFQGPFKWSIVTLAAERSELLKQAQILNARQLTRMLDQEYLAHLISGLTLGMITSSPAKLTSIYKNFEKTGFPEAQIVERYVNSGLDWLSSTPEIFGTALVKLEVSLSLLWAAIHAVHNVPSLHSVGEGGKGLRSKEEQLMNLLTLQDAIETYSTDETFAPEYESFVKASAQGTNTLSNRTTRTRAFLTALQRD